VLEKLISLLRSLYPHVEIEYFHLFKYSISPLAGAKVLLEYAPLILQHSPRVVITPIDTTIFLQLNPPIRIMLIQRLKDMDVEPEINLAVELPEDSYRKLLELMPEEHREVLKRKILGEES